MEIRSLEIDFDVGILKINGEMFTDKPVMVTLPGTDGWMLRKLFNVDQKKNAEEITHLKIYYEESDESGCDTENE